MRDCFSHFKSDVNEWEEILDTFMELQAIRGSRLTVAARQRTFKGIFRKVTQHVRRFEAPLSTLRL